MAADDVGVQELEHLWATESTHGPCWKNRLLPNKDTERNGHNVKVSFNCEINRVHFYVKLYITCNYS